MFIGIFIYIFVWKGSVQNSFVNIFTKLVACLLNFLENVFWRPDVFHFNEVEFINYLFSLIVGVLITFKQIFLTVVRKIFSYFFLLKALKFYLVCLGMYTFWIIFCVQYKLGFKVYRVLLIYKYLVVPTLFIKNFFPSH